MKAVTHEWISIVEGDWATAKREIRVKTDTNYRAVSFHAQQCGEKYLKAYLQEKSVNPERKHKLQILLDKILPFEPTWLNLQESWVELTDLRLNIGIQERRLHLKKLKMRSLIRGLFVLPFGNFSAWKPNISSIFVVQITNR